MNDPVFCVIKCAKTTKKKSLHLENLSARRCARAAAVGSELIMSNFVNEANLVHKFSQYVYFFSLHVSGDYVHIIMRDNCIYATLGTCYSVWMTVCMQGELKETY